ncbi:peptidoglycan glycosyltransferase [Thiobacillus denitrificans ATCC 25259]|uniref:Peptidoglycan D,D-transpeptidase FtsI n=1 Tax=Thiobacillus denitrificans (strain ATCC 25259 / T1) TaxID=292415 RepID=Q3SMH9_THIDA|nr:penicillin-binding protein 2 [Thiobacillus denitrificans]AAZ96066.1 peptidoglycan glycosyltransferase [Thiobacillus denitrificans ATCC 25259]
MNYHSRRLLRLNLAPWRMATVAGLLLAGLTVVGGRAFYLQGLNTDYLQGKGDAVANRQLTLPAQRGQVADRHGQLLAISTPVESLWARPTELRLDDAQRAQLARVLGVSPQALAKTLGRKTRGEFSVRRPVTPEQAVKIAAMGIPGLHLRREFRRYYPAGEVAAHVVGFTNVDDLGQEGVERAYQDWLAGREGKREILRDRRGNTIRDLAPIKTAQMGGNLALALDLKIQYLAHRELAAAIEAHKAKGGSVVVLDAKTGEILALANQPIFNPNNRHDYAPGPMRNRAVIDTFEPGSTIKPFVAAAVLERGLYDPDSVIDTPETWRVGRKLVRDVHPHPQMTVSEIIQKSSNVGAVKLAMSLTPQQYWEVLHRAGFGERPGSGFPGETAGRLRDAANWKPVEHATMAYGYGLSVSLLQLTRAYMAFANDGEVMPLSFLKREPQEIVGVRVFSPTVAREVRAMMEAVTQEGGTGLRTRVPGYRVAGKTGTAHKLVDGRYAPDRYLSSFVGMAPASNPRLIIGVVIDEPSGGVYYGGSVAGPVFAQVMAASLRQLALPPDAPETATHLTHNVRPARGGGA